MKAQLDRIEARLDEIYASVHGNGEPGLKTLVDRNSGFRRMLTKLLWILFTPLYAGLIGVCLKAVLSSN